MSRTHYKNGDEIDSPGGCDGCKPTMIQDVLCHETGCPEAWKDQEVECFECGWKFCPSERPSRQKSLILCGDCANQETIDLDEIECPECGGYLDADGTCADCENNEIDIENEDD